MNLARLTSAGQITVPAEIRRELKIVPGGKILFVKNKDNEIVIKNASMSAWDNLQKAFEGEAERIGWKDEQDVVNYIKDLRN